MAELRCIIIGAGVSGLLMVHKLKERFGQSVKIQVFEKNADVGGTWLENRYPGCACDVPSHIYQYSFAPNPYWSRIYASSTEIQQYLVAFTQHFDLKQHIQFSTCVTKAEWNQQRSAWVVEIGNDQHYECDVLINATGILSNPYYPKLKNLEYYKGLVLHTAAWDVNADLKNQRLAIIGAGATAIQVLPALQPQAEHIDIYIRTPSWITKILDDNGTDAINRNYTEDEVLRYVNDGAYSLQQRKHMEDYYNAMFRTFMKGSSEQTQLRIRLDARMRELIPNEELQRKLIPSHDVGCRRINPGESYLYALQKPNVEPVFDPIDEITPSGIRSGGQERPVDVIILATGFDTSFRPRFPIIGLDGQNLQELWKDEPTSYLGIAVSGFPNYLTFLGPNTPIANGSVLGSLEATADHFINLLSKFQKENVASFDVFPDVQADFDEHTQQLMKNMVWSGTCRSWYRSTQNGKVTAIWPGSSLHYREVLAAGRFEDFRWKYKTNRFAYWKDGFSAVELDDNVPVKDLSYYMKPHPNLPKELFRSSTAPPLDENDRLASGIEVVAADVNMDKSSSVKIPDDTSSTNTSAGVAQKGATIKVLVMDASTKSALVKARPGWKGWLKKIRN